MAKLRADAGPEQRVIRDIKTEQPAIISSLLFEEVAQPVQNSAIATLPITYLSPKKWLAICVRA